MPSPFGLSQDDHGRLLLIDADGRRHEGVRPVRAFPFSDPRHWISICDPRGQELACVEDVEQLPEPSRRLLLDELAQREFTPLVTRIRRVTAAPDGSQWEVETDRGPTTIRLESDDAIRNLKDGRVLLIDDHNIRYLIPDVHHLDPASRRKLERHL